MHNFRFVASAMLAWMSYYTLLALADEEPTETRILTDRFLPEGTVRFSPARAGGGQLLSVYKGQIFMQGGAGAKQGQLDWKVVTSRPRNELVAVFGAAQVNEADDMAYDTWGKSNRVVSKGPAPGGTWQLLTVNNVREVGCYFRVGEGEFEGYYLNFEERLDDGLTRLVGNPCFRAIVTPKPGTWSLLQMDKQRVRTRAERDKGNYDSK